MDDDKNKSNILINNDLARITLAYLPLPAVLKDNQCRYLMANEEHAKLAGFQSVEQTLGLTDYDLKCDAAEFAPKYIQQDQDTILHGKQTNIDICHYGDNEVHFFATKKVPVLNAEGKAAGTLSVMMELEANLLEHVFMLTQLNCKTNKVPFGSYHVNENQKKTNLTQRQNECLFLLLRGNSVKQIGKILDLSPRTIEGYIYTLKSKFYCYSKQGLIDKAVEQGYFFLIPKRFVGGVLR